MFDRIAGVYDLMNGVMTAGLHHQWRRRAADLAALAPGGRVLDVATGTGDLALELAQRVGSRRHGRRRRLLARGCSSLPARSPTERAPRSVELRFEQANALSLPYADDEFDAATVGFGARNFSDLRRGLSEMGRVVRPGGQVVVLEITTPTRPPLSTFLELWFDRIVPALGRLAGDAEAYSYLPSSVRRFPAPQELAGADVGLRLAFGPLPADRRWDHRAARGRGVPVSAGGMIALQAGEVLS